MTFSKGMDAAGCDPEIKLAFSSNGEGILSIVEASNSNNNVLQTVSTQQGNAHEGLRQHNRKNRRCDGSIRAAAPSLGGYDSAAECVK